VAPDQQLAAAFLAELGSRDDLAAYGGERELESQLAGACARAGAAFEDILVDDQTFARHLGRVARRGRSAPLPLSDLAIDDLYLVCACLSRAARAVDTFANRHRRTIRTAVARLAPGADGHEVEQTLLAALLVGCAGAPPKIEGYTGKGPLDRWVQVAAQRAALTWLRENRAEGRARQAAAEDPLLAGSAHPELAYLKQRYRLDFEQALAAAITRLPERDRFLLRLQVVDGLAVEKIGKMYSVRQSTASRWLAAARAALLADVKTMLHDRLGASSEEIASLAGLVASRIDLSLSRLLKAR
jgi:RNA polymerase sigma-70 factor (ECF subfamily)